MGDEERVGIAKRYSSPIKEFYPQVNGDFAAEYFLDLKNPANASPARLLRYTEGLVVDDLGKQIKCFTTGVPLRSQKLWYTTDDAFVRREIDEQGNMLTMLPMLATRGYELSIPNGSYKATIHVDRDVAIDGNEIVTVGKDISYTVSGNVDYEVAKAYNIVAGGNAFTMDDTVGEETVGLVTAGTFLGFQAENTADGGLTSIFGPNGSGAYWTGTGSAQFQDGKGGALTLDGATADLSAADGDTVNIGKNSLIVAHKTGLDWIELSNSLVQISTGNAFNLVGTVANFKVGGLFLGNNAIIPCVMGLALIIYNDTHVHLTLGLPGNPPTSPPIIPMMALVGSPMSTISTQAFLAPPI